MNHRFECVKKPLMWSTVLLLSALAAGCGGRDNGRDPILGGPSIAAVPANAPTVTSTVPENAATGVQINRRITATFSEPTMSGASITTASFKVVGPLAVAVAGTVTYTGSTAVFTPSSPLAVNSLYTATITTLAKNQAGIAMAEDFTWSFQSGLTSDTTAPTVISTGAANGDTGLPINRDITATFSEPMNPATFIAPANNFTVCATGAVQGGPCLSTVAGVVTYLGNTATFNPNVDLSPNTWYTVTVAAGATDLADNALVAGLRPNPWSWQTAATPESVAPTVTITNPAHLAAAPGLGTIPVTQTINATFSEAMSPATMVTANFTVMETASLVSVVGAVSYDAVNHIASFLPQNPLTPDTSYTVTVSNAATDLANNPLVAGLVPNPWTFRTAPASVPPVALAINLRGAATFGIAASAAVTSTGVTVVNGDVAITPTPTCTDATGGPGGAAVPPPGCAVKAYGSHPTGLTVNGSVYFFGDPFDSGVTANAVKNDLNSAWVEGKNKVDTFAVGFLVGELGGPGPDGKVLLPGVYHEANLGLAAGNVVTLDAANDANAIFIFKVDVTFVDSGTALLPTQVKLTRGAQAKNVWFVIGLDATIGHGTIWNGNILAGQTVTVLDGSTVNGRVLGGAIPGGSGAISLTGAATTVTTINVP